MSPELFHEFVSVLMVLKFTWIECYWQVPEWEECNHRVREEVCDQEERPVSRILYGCPSLYPVETLPLGM